MRSVGTVLQVRTEIGCSITGLGSAVGHTNAGWTGMGSGALMGWWVIAGHGVCERMRTGSTVTSLGEGLTGVGVVELLGTTGLRPQGLVDPPPARLLVRSTR